MEAAVGYEWASQIKATIVYEWACWIKATIGCGRTQCEDLPVTNANILCHYYRNIISTIECIEMAMHFNVRICQWPQNGPALLKTYITYSVELAQLASNDMPLMVSDWPLTKCCRLPLRHQ